MKENIQFSVDLETFGITGSKPVIAIGVAAFDMETGKIFDKFYLNITWQSNIDLGRPLEAGTVAWWMQQSDEARAALLDKNAEAVSVKTALEMMANWMLNIVPKDDVKPWGNGATFDISPLDDLYNLFGMEPPWIYWNVRDMRTIVDLANLDKKELKREGTHHNAVDDAVFQAQVISRCWRKLHNLGKV